MFVLALDLDGVVADYPEGFRQFIATRKNVPVNTIPYPTDWSFVKSGWPIASTEEYLDLHDEAVGRGLFATLPSVAGATEALNELSDNDIYIRVVTHRLINSGAHQRVISDTARWLDETDIPYRDICFVENKTDISADIFVEDSPSNINALTSVGKNVIAFTQPYNQWFTFPHAVRTHSWEETKDEILRLADR